MVRGPYVENCSRNFKQGNSNPLTNKRHKLIYCAESHVFTIYVEVSEFHAKPYLCKS